MTDPLFNPANILHVGYFCTHKCNNETRAIISIKSIDLTSGMRWYTPRTVNMGRQTLACLRAKPTNKNKKRCSEFV